MKKLTGLLLGMFLATPAFAQDTMPAEGGDEVAPMEQPMDEPTTQPESAPAEEPMVEEAAATHGGAGAIGIVAALRELVAYGGGETKTFDTEYMALMVEQLTYGINDQLTFRWGTDVVRYMPVASGPGAPMHYSMLTLPLKDTGDTWALTVNPYVDYLLNENLTLFGGILLYEVAGDKANYGAGARDEIGDNVKNINVGANYTMAAGGMNVYTGLDFFYIGSESETGYHLLIPVGVVMEMSGLTLKPGIAINYWQAPADIDAEFALGLHVPVLYHINDNMGVGGDVNVDDLAEAADTIRIGAVFHYDM